MEGSDGGVSVISRRFCSARSVDLAVTKRVWQIVGRGDYVIKDVGGNGNLMFKVERSFFSFDRTTVILDAAGLPLVTLREKRFSTRSRWEVFRGVSTDKKDLIFSAKRSGMFQMKPKLHVFLANNISEDVCDYTLQGSWLGRSCRVNVGDSSTLIAQMQKNSSIESKFTGKNRFTVTVYPHIDYVFIVALIIIFDKINTRRKRSSNNARTY